MDSAAHINIKMFHKICNPLFAPDNTPVPVLEPYTFRALSNMDRRSRDIRYPIPILKRASWSGDQALPRKQGTFLPTTFAAELDDMAAHDELSDAAKKIRDRMSALRAQEEHVSASLGEVGRRGSLRRSQSLSAAEVHLANFHRIVRVRLHHVWHLLSHGCSADTSVLQCGHETRHLAVSLPSGRDSTRESGNRTCIPACHPRTELFSFRLKTVHTSHS